MNLRSMDHIAKTIRDRITTAGNPEKAGWLERYVKHRAKSRGTGIPEIRKILKEIERETACSKKPLPQQVRLLNNLMEQVYTEEKLAAILYIQLFWKNKHEEETLALISNWFDQTLITDWNVCDWLCVRILTPLLDHRPKSTIAKLKRWNKSKNLWKARASLVPFAQSRFIGQYGKLIKSLAGELIKRDERFCKTAVGWVLREYSKQDPVFVRDFLSEFEAHTTKEVVRNASKYLPKQQ